MKQVLFFLILLLYYKCAYGKMGISVQPIKYADDKTFLQVGLAKKIVCSGTTKNQKLDWYDPSGKLVRRQPGSRVHVQDQVTLSYKETSNTRGLILSIAHSTISDSGVWQCRSGSLRANVSLCVLDPVEFVDPETEVDVANGRSVTLSCKVEGDPEPTIVWHRNGEVIADDGTTSKYKVMTTYFSEGIEGLLTLTSLNNKDSGIYSCEAYQENLMVEDCYHADVLNITLNVNHAPYFENDNITEYSLENESVELECFAVAYPQPTYRWFYEIDDILKEVPGKSFTVADDGSSSTLTLKINASNFGKRYACKANNDYGSDYTMFTVLQLEEPVKPSKLYLANLTHDSITIQWNEAENPFPVDNVELQYFEKRSRFPPREYQWRRAKTATVNYDDADPSITLRGLDEDSSYWIRLRLLNRAGESEWTSPILASTGTFEEDDESANIIEIAELNPPEQVTTAGYNSVILGMSCLALVVFVGVACMLVIKRL